MTNRGQQNKNDDWLTPPPLLKALGRFDMDPCCPPVMPWPTARVMLTDRAPTAREVKAVERFTGAKAFRPRLRDGLQTDWRGRVLLNNPYSEPSPWMERMADHGRGMVIASAKSTDTRWCQRLLSTCDAVYFLDDRISFCYPSGEQSAGAWSPYLLAAYGRADVTVLECLAFKPEWPGVLMTRVGP